MLQEELVATLAQTSGTKVVHKKLKKESLTYNVLLIMPTMASNSSNKNTLEQNSTLFRGRQLNSKSRKIVFITKDWVKICSNWNSHRVCTGGSATNSAITLEKWHFPSWL